MKYGKFIAMFLCGAVLAGSLAGCGGKDSGNVSSQEPEKGRYVETQETLPQELEGWSLRQIFSAGDEIRLLATKQENDTTVISEWKREDGNYANVTQDWLSSLEIPCGDWLEIQMMQDGKGEEYLYAGYAAEGEEYQRGHLWKGKDGEPVEITPEKWTVPDESWGGYETILGIGALDNGTLAVLTYLSYDLLSGEDGSLLQSEPISTAYEEPVVSNGSTIFLCASDASGVRIEKRKDGGKSDCSPLAFPTESSGSVSLCALKDGSLIAAGDDGIFRCGADSTNWEKLLSGQETDLGLTECWCTGIAALEGGPVFALFRESGGGSKVNRYEYDPDAVIEVTQKLNLYTVYESSLLQQAAVMYHKEHPEILIDIQYVYPAYYYDETDYNAVYQELNTMLMSEDAPDILVMDHLNMDSFISKGLLADVSGVVEPLEESGELLSNITGAYAMEDGSRYVVPLQFGINMAIGRDIAEENMETLEALADFLSKSTESYMGSQTVSELVDHFYPYFCGEIVSGKQLDKEALGRNLDYLKKIADNCGIIDSREKDERGYNMWDLASGAKLAFTEANGYKDCLFPIAIKDYIQGNFTAFGHSFIPSLQTGIYAKSPYKDTAMDFLRFALTEGVQDTDYYKGFPVNSASLEKQSHQDRSEAEAYTTIEAEGGEVEFAILDYSEETADKLTALCKSLDNPVKEDEKIREVLIESLDGYLKGSQTKEAAMQQIEDGLKMYLAE